MIVRDIFFKRTAKAILMPTAVALFAFFFISCTSSGPATEQSAAALDDSAIGRAFASRATDIQVEGEGTVIGVLADDLDGSRHQRSSFSFRRDRHC
jgi:hypothetical protein